MLSGRLAPLGQNARRGKKLRLEGHVRTKRVAGRWCVRENRSSATAGVSGCTDLYNRQLHPDERKWAKDNASKFAQFYEEKTGQTITADQAQQMLLASGYRIVDAAASAGPAPDGNRYATAFISENGGGLFRATPAEYSNPFLYGNADHSLTPEQPSEATSMRITSDNSSLEPD